MASSEQSHSHCSMCVQMFCNERVSGCEMTWCELSCGACFHACKREEHGIVCSNKWTDCVNAGYGCPLTMPRWQIMNHIKRCPASVVHCTMEWNRRFSSSNKQLQQQPEYSKQSVHTSQLDVALAVRDQQVLMQSQLDDHLLKSASPLPSSESSSLAKKLKNCFYDVKCSHCERRKSRFETRHGQLHSHGEGIENGFIARTEKISTNEESVSKSDKIIEGSKEYKKEILNSKMFSDCSRKNMKSVEQATHLSEGAAANHQDQQVTVDLTLESMPRYQRKPSSMHTFLCQKDFRRDEINDHIQHVHSEIHAGLNGWLEPRCPLAQYGCTFSQHRFHPDNKGTKVIYSQELESFGLKPKPVSRHKFTADSDMDGKKETKNCISAIGSKTRFEKAPIDFEQARYNLAGTDYISHLPLELLRHIVRMLDSFSISSLSLTSHTFRHVCCSLLEERGIVVPRWVKLNGAWEIKSMVWHFSTSFTGINKWKFEESHIISEHLKTCEYNSRLPVSKQRVKVIITGTNPIPLRNVEINAAADQAVNQSKIDFFRPF